jgi:myo-inositol-1(or 4)-monophosphatase
MVSLLGKYSKFAGAGEKAGVRAALAETAQASTASTPLETAAPDDAASNSDAPF